MSLAVFWVRGTTSTARGSFAIQVVALDVEDAIKGAKEHFAGEVVDVSSVETIHAIDAASERALRATLAKVDLERAEKRADAGHEG